jgi:hypothetical protein
MFSLDSLISVTKSNILDNISLHSIPPIGCLEIVIHLIPFLMNGIRGLMSLTQYLILHLLDARHTNPSSVSQYSLAIFCKTR